MGEQVLGITALEVLGDGTTGAMADMDMDGEDITTLGTEAHGDGEDTTAADGVDMAMVTVMDGEDITIPGMVQDVMGTPIMVITEIETMRTTEEDGGITIIP